MRRLIGLLIGLPILVIAASFAGSNLQSVTLTLFPLPFEAEVSIALVVYVALVAGFVAGAVIAWFGAGRLRHRARENEIAARRAANEVERLKSTAERNAARALEAPKGERPKALAGR
ncbi:MAG: LapA family protein [Alphaproteobacteria bacterium]|nr:LapA family protein [Alphaproteobacteria bacterium]